MGTKFILILWMLTGRATTIETRGPVAFDMQEFGDRAACQAALETMLQENRPETRFSFDGVCVPQSTAPRSKAKKKAR